mgnify:CR=1 FL=1
MHLTEKFEYNASEGVKGMDIEKITGELEKSGKAANTIIVFTSDNGLCVGEHGLLGKQNLYEAAVRIPMVICGPGIPQNTVRDAYCYLYDLYPTLCGLAGIEVYDLLRDEYDIQIEFGDIGNILAYLSIGDRPQELERLVSALAEIRRRYQTDGSGLMNQEYIAPEVVTSPQEAFYADKRSVRLEDSVGQVCSEFVMCYPPGIPILAPGERITAEILDYIRYAKEKGCSMTGPEDPEIEEINILTQEAR